MNKFIAPLIAVFLLSACSSNRRVEEDVKFTYARKPSPYYTVQEGETLTSIASKHGIREEEIIRMNDFTMPYELIPGQKVIIFPKTKKPEESKKIISDDIEIESSNTDTNSQTPNEERSERPQEGLVLNPQMEPKSDINQETSEQSTEDTPKASTTGYHWPVKGKVTKKIDTDKNGKLSGGIDIAAPEGTPVYATNAGVVVKADVDVKGLGKTIIIKHKDGIMSVYSHLKSCMVKSGQTVDTDTVIGRVGKTGGIKKPMLHLQLRGSDKTYIDPLKRLR